YNYCGVGLFVCEVPSDSSL
ncbi:putative inner membrane protein, partial [Chlamydia psittaci 84-8471/1]